MKLTLIDGIGKIIAERSHEYETYLAFKDREYAVGDKIILEVSQPNTFIWVQVDEAIAPSLIYLKEKIWQYPILLDEELKRAHSPKIFSGKRHYIKAFLPQDYEINNYRNLALNAHDQKNPTGAFPHAFANVETRNDATFFARNAIDGFIANENHGSFPYQSWGINQQADAEITIDFGRNVLLNKIALVLRGDYPHDSYWTQATLAFSNHQSLTIGLTDVIDRQIIEIPLVETTSLTLKNLIKHHDDSPFPALTQVEAYGWEIKEDEI